MPYVHGLDLRNDVLFRGGESAGASDWNDKAMDYLNRAYSALASGASEFLPEFIEDWWWMRATGSLLILPSSTGSASVTNGLDAISFAVAPSVSLVGYRIRFDGNPDVFVITTHTAGTTPATLDTVYTGSTSASADYDLMKTVYELDAAVQALIGPVNLFNTRRPINGMSPEAMDRVWPLSRLQLGIPQAFALESETTIRMSHGGRTDGVTMRAEYRYRPVVTPLTANVNSIPLVPQQYRHVLSDMALAYLFSDKNDTRAADAGSAARAVLAGMAKENRRRIAKIDSKVGRISPRPTHRFLPDRLYITEPYD